MNNIKGINIESEDKHLEELLQELHLLRRRSFKEITNISLKEINHTKLIEYGSSIEYDIHKAVSKYYNIFEITLERSDISLDTKIKKLKENKKGIIDLMNTICMHECNMLHEITGIPDRYKKDYEETLHKESIHHSINKFSSDLRGRFNNIISYILESKINSFVNLNKHILKSEDMFSQLIKKRNTHKLISYILLYVLTGATGFISSIFFGGFREMFLYTAPIVLILSSLNLLVISKINKNTISKIKTKLINSI